MQILKENIFIVLAKSGSLLRKHIVYLPLK